VKPLVTELNEQHTCPARYGIEDTMEATWWERIEGKSEEILKELKRLVEDGNARRVVVKQGDRTIAEFPMTAGVIGVVLAPVAAAIGALTALLTDCTIEVEKSSAGPDIRPE